MISELRLLGGAALVADDGHPISGGAAQPRRLAVLALLAEAWPSAVTRDRIIGLIWPEQDEQGARRLLTQALYELRRELGAVVRPVGRDLAIDPELLRIDLVEFRRAVREGNLEAAVALHRGPLLDGFHLRDAGEFERWAEPVRAEVRRQLQQALETLAERGVADGRPRDAARWAERLAQLSPLDGDAVVRAMDLLDRVGDRGAALAAAAVHERGMRDELELDAAPVVRRRARELRARAADTPPVGMQSVAAAPERGDADAPSSDAPSSAGAAPAIATPQAPRVSRRHAAIVLVAAAIVASTAALVVAVRARPPVAPAGRTLSIRPFTLHGDAPSSPTIQSDVAALVAANLDGAAGARVVPLPAGAPDSAWGELRGDVVSTGSELRIDASLRIGDRRVPPLTASVAGPRDSLIPLIERLSRQLLPALYGDAGVVAGEPALAAMTRVPALRSFLDGELAWRRGAYDDAYAAFSRATELDSGVAFAWYRRALAAELAHHADDADRAIAVARSRAPSSAGRERQLYEGYQRWRAGDAMGAEQIFRRLLAADSRDREAWLHLAEIAYHAWPLHGRRLDDARDPWSRLVTLDSGNFPALMHALRLAARARDTAAVRAMSRRAAALHPTGSSAAESRVVAAYAVGDRSEVQRVQSTLDELPDYSLGFLNATIAGLLEQPADAEPIARRMISPSRPDAVQGEGHLALAHLALARGHWRAASRELDLASRYMPVAAAWSRAYFATLPYLDSPKAVRDQAVRALAAAPPTQAAAPLYLQLAVDVAAVPVISRYLSALLLLPDDPSSPDARMSLPCAPLAANLGALCADMTHGLDAERSRRLGRTADALREVESVGTVVPYQLAGRSMFFARSRERFLRADLLERMGRFEEAYAWYEAAPHGAWMDYVYLAPSHLRRARIRERLGDKSGAARHYRRVLELWRDPDPEMAGLRREAEEGLARTGAR